MKTSIAIFFTLLLAPIASVANADFFFRAMIDKAQANQGNGTGSLATGVATLVLNDAMTELSMNIQFDGITTDDMTGFHIHAAPAGANGPVVFGLKSPNSDVDGDFMDFGTGFSSVWDGQEGNGTTLAAQLDNLFNEGLYFNAHTAAFPGGEIRGQILQIPEPASAGLLVLCIGALTRRRR